MASYDNSLCRSLEPSEDKKYNKIILQITVIKKVSEFFCGNPIFSSTL